MSSKNHFMTVKDLMVLMGTDSYHGAAKALRAIKDAIAPNKKKLLIKEFCDHEKLDYDYVWEILRE